MGLAVSLVILTETWRAYSTGHCSLYAVDSWVRHSVASPQSKRHIIQLCSGPASVRLSCVLTEKPLSISSCLEYSQRLPSKNNITTDSLSNIPQCDCGAEDTMAHHVTWCNHHYETKHLDEMTISTLMITACAPKHNNTVSYLFTQLRRHRQHLT